MGEISVDDAVESRARRAMPVDLAPSSDRAVLDQAPRTDVAWLGPYPGFGLPDGPAARYDRREAVELAFVAAIQHLPGNQRAALLLFEVLGFSAAEIAEMTDTTTTSVNSALARARRIVEEKIPDRTRLRRNDDAEVRAVVDRFAAALENGDPDAFVAVLTEDVTWSMPPLPHWYRGIAAVTEFAVEVPLTHALSSRQPSWPAA